MYHNLHLTTQCVFPCSCKLNEWHSLSAKELIWSTLGLCNQPVRTLEGGHLPNHKLRHPFTHPLKVTESVQSEDEREMKESTYAELKWLQGNGCIQHINIKAKTEVVVVQVKWIEWIGRHNILYSNPMVVNVNHKRKLRNNPLTTPRILQN